MQTTCTNCGAKYTLDDSKVGAHPRVQFKCAKCGQTTVVDVTRNPDRTRQTSPLPSFARGEMPKMDATIISQTPGLALPRDKTITLSIISGPSKGLVFQMTKARAVLGRTGADVEINDPEISRWHCAVEVKDENIRLKDLDSTNGTYFGDERVRAAELSHLAEFRIGTSTILVTVLQKT